MRTLLSLFLGAALVAVVAQCGMLLEAPPPSADVDVDGGPGVASPGSFADSFDVHCDFASPTRIKAGGMHSVYCQNNSANPAVVGDSTHVADGTGVSFCTSTDTCPRWDWGHNVREEYCSATVDAGVDIACIGQVERSAAP